MKGILVLETGTQHPGTPYRISQVAIDTSLVTAILSHSLMEDKIMGQIKGSLRIIGIGIHQVAPLCAAKEGKSKCQDQVCWGASETAVIMWKISRQETLRPEVIMEERGQMQVPFTSVATPHSINISKNRNMFTLNNNLKTIEN